MIRSIIFILIAAAASAASAQVPVLARIQGFDPLERQSYKRVSIGTEGIASEFRSLSERIARNGRNGFPIGKGGVFESYETGYTLSWETAPSGTLLLVKLSRIFEHRDGNFAVSYRPIPEKGVIVRSIGEEAHPWIVDVADAFSGELRASKGNREVGLTEGELLVLEGAGIQKEIRK